MKIFLYIVFFALVSLPAFASSLEIEADDALEWDRKNGIVTARGNAVVIKDDMTLKADLLTAYYTEEEGGNMTIQKIVATGNPKAIKGKDVISANLMTAYMANSRLDHIKVEGNVKIVTPTEQAESKYATYKTATEVVSMQGDVSIKRGANILLGDKAEFDLKTDVARLMAAPVKADGTKTRVRGVFYLDDKPSSATKGAQQ
jgi:lipopolysaccharide export system protein LptA